MIGFNELGKLGRLGNQMFQFASLKGIARNRGFQFCIPPTKNQNQWTDHQLFNCFKLNNTNSLNVQYIDFDRPVLVEDTFSFNQKIFEECPDWVSLQGYFQTEKYFKNIESEIKSDFEFKEEIFNPCKEMISQVSNPISLHIRRTDYITSPNHTSLSLEYYEKALNNFHKDRNVIIFSDDPSWCKEQKLFSDDRFLISENNDNYIDLCLMTLCDSHIIANSSFSWWGSWLSNSNQVIAPSGWFKGTKNDHLDTNDLYCSNWLVL